jgi:RimJ/RimL family protein N-acetyltransferase
MRVACEHRAVTLPDLLCAYEPLAIADGLVLRAVTVGDGPALAAFVADNQQHLSRYLAGLVEEIVDVRSAVQHCRAMVKLQAQGALLELYLVDGDDRMCGSVRLRDVDGRSGSANVGYLLAADHVGRGLATRAVAGVVDWAFTVLQLHRVELRCVASNRASAAVAGRLGFTLEGRLRDCELIDGEFHDDLVFSRLATDGGGVSR